MDLASLASLFGFGRAAAPDAVVPATPLALPKRVPAYPGEAELALSRQYEQMHGDPNSGFTVPGGATVRTIPLERVPGVANSGPMAGGNPVPVDNDLADQLHKAALASKRSAVAAIGFDPRNMMISPKSNRALTDAGLYTPKSDTMWYDANFDSTPVHESFHRGFRKLREEGVLPAPGAQAPKEELLVRALMLRHFGDAELGRGAAGDRQIEQGRGVLKSHGKYLDEIEKAAADSYARRRPGGPR